MEKANLIVLSIYSGYHPFNYKKTIIKKNKSVLIIFDDVILEPDSHKTSGHYLKMLDKRYRNFIDCFALKTRYKTMGKNWRGNPSYLKIINEVQNNKIFIIVKGKVAMYRYKRSRGGVYTRQPWFLKEKSPYAKNIRFIISTLLNNHSAQYAQNKLKERYNITISLAELYKIKNARNQQIIGKELRLQKYRKLKEQL